MTVTKNHWIQVSVCQDKIDLPNESSELSGNEVHVWLAKIDQLHLWIERFSQILSEEELTKANNFIFIQDKDRFIVSHGLLRIMLANYVKIDPKQLKFNHAINGKPYITTKYSIDSDLSFNMSHSHNVAIYTFTLNRRIGVDIEFIRYIKNIDQLINFVFSKNDRMTIDTLPEKQKQEAFLNIWTRKEAYVKAIGGCLSNICSQYSFLSDIDKPIDLLCDELGRSDTSDWFFQTLLPDSDYIATIAVESSDPQFKYFSLAIL
jgi:4'-phosphopantetheinyl transferase